MKRFIHLLIVGIFNLGALNCKKVYYPPTVKNNPHLLVVDGIVISGNDSTIITISRTKALSDSLPAFKEKNAKVSVIGVPGLEYPLTDQGNGRYATGGPYSNSLVGQDLDTNHTAVYLYSTNLCVDCTVDGGSTIKPSFWP